MPAPEEILVHHDQGLPPIRCNSVAEMDAALDRLHATALSEVAAGDRCPLHVSIAFPGFEVNTGLGVEETFVMVGAEPFDDWYVALGDVNAQGDEVMFFGVAQDSYWAPKHLLPVAVARDAVRHFVENQRRTPTLKWEH